jgi:AraC-like DNA-binding protein
VSARVRRAPLDAFRTFASRDAEEIRAFLATQQFAVSLPAREARHADARINGVHVSTDTEFRGAGPRSGAAAPAVFRVPGSRSGLYLGFLEYGCAIELRGLPTRDDYRILLPVRGGVETVAGTGAVARRRGGAVVTSPSATKLVRLERDTALLNLFLKGPELNRQLAALLGEAVGAPIEFAAGMDVTVSYGRSLWEYATTAIADIERSGPLLGNPLAASLFEQFIVLGLLQSQPHNYSAALHRPSPSIAPRSVKRAIDYMRANLDAPLTIADLAAVSGVAGKTLWTHFRTFTGTTPMRYLRNARLDDVQKALRRAEREESITAIAMSRGFGHLGRFSRQYRERFGETPSETLRRRR